MKTFRYIHSVAVYVMLSVILILSGVGVYFNIYSAFNCDGVIPKIISYCVLAAICLILIAAVGSVIIKSQYVIKDGKLCLYFGVVSVKTDINDMVSITLIKKSNRLVAEFTGSRFSAVVIAPQYFDEFICSVREVKADIIYNVDSSGTEEPEE